MAEFLRTLLTLTVLGSVLAGLLMFVRPLVKSRTVYYYLWLLVLVRLCLPAGIALSLPAPIQSQTERPAAVEPVDQPEVQPARPEVRPAQPETGPGWQGSGEAVQDGPEEATQPERPFRPEAGAPQPAFDWREVLAAPALWLAVWGLGAALCLGRQAWGYRRFVRLVRASGQAPGPEALALLATLDRTGRVGLTVCPHVTAPMLIGAVRPVVVLPCGVERDRLGDILAHELTHARRHDLLYKWFAVAATSLHWFNPLMLVVRRQLSRACELSCDAAVVRALDTEGRRHYGETLLALAEKQGKEKAGLLAATLCEEKAHLKERLVSVMRLRKQGPAALALTLALALILTGCAAVFGVAPTPRPVADPEALLDEPALYRLPDGLTAALPQELEEKLLVRTPKKGPVILEVYDKGSYQAGGRAAGDKGWLFSLARYDQAGFEEALTADGTGRTFVAREEGWYYACLTPTDVRFCSEAEDQTEDLAVWTELTRRLPSEFLPDFLSRNSLEAFDESEIYHDGCLWEGEHVYVGYEGAESLTLLLSQPVRQGAGGIWCVEGRFDNGRGTSARVLPTGTGLPAADYYAQLQAEADQGGHAELLTPEGAALEWLGERYDGVTAGQVARLEGTPAWDLTGRVLEPITGQRGGLTVLRNGQRETWDEDVDGRLPFDGLDRWPWVEAQGPDSLYGSDLLVYNGVEGTLFIEKESGLLGVKTYAWIYWYRWAGEPDTTPYEQLLGDYQRWKTEQPIHTYSKIEVFQAKTAVEDYFAGHYPGCWFPDIDYAPRASYEAAYDYWPTDDQAEMDRRMVLCLDLFTDDTQEVLEPGAYFNVEVILRRADRDAPWTVWDIRWPKPW